MIIDGAYAMKNKNLVFDKIGLAIVFISLLVISTISYLLDIGFCGFILMCLPLFFGLLFTSGMYPRYGKSLKSFIDAILYFQASIIAVLLVIKTVIKVPEDFFTSHLYTLHGFFYVYAMAIVAVIKCCVSYLDGRMSYKEEKQKIAEQASNTTDMVKKLSSEKKLSLVVGTTLITLLILLFK